MAPKQKDKPNIKLLEIENPRTGQKVDLEGGCIELNYYESILSNHITAAFIYGETGNTVGKGKSAKDLLNGLPVRGGEPLSIRVTDAQNKELKFTGKDRFYVNRVKNIVQDTKTTIGEFDLCTKEFLSNEMTRVEERFSGKISESVRKIAQDHLEIQTVDVEETSNSYNFIGNQRKPFFTLTWLGTKAIPADGAQGKTAGFFFFQTQDGYQFKSAESLIGPTKGGGSADSKGAKKFEFTNTKDSKEGFAKILQYNLNKNIDVQEKLVTGSYNNVSHFFNPYTFKVKEQEFSISQQDGSVKTAGTDLDFVNKEFTTTPTRGMTMVLDVGTMPSGTDGKKQVKQWKEKPDETNDQIMKRVVQSIMRYNQLFSVNVDIMIEGDFSLKAGDTIYCEFPGLGAETKRPSKDSSGLYLIASVCHKVTSSRAYTSLNLIRDSFGKTKAN